MPSLGIHEFAVGPLYQGMTNGCGTTSLAMALNTLYAQHAKPPHPVTQAQLDKDNRELDSFSSPGMLRKVAQDYGVFAGLYNNATFEELRAHLDKQRPVIALHKPSPKDNVLHYAIIHGYEDHTNPAERKITITDPGNAGVARRVENFKSFCESSWDNIRLGKLKTGLNRFMLVLSHQNNLPQDRDVPVTVFLANLGNSAVNWFAKFKRVWTTG